MEFGAFWCDYVMILTFGLCLALQKCSACSKARHKAHGAPIQCTKGKCPKAFHVSCAKNGAAANIIFTILREVEKDVVLLDSTPPSKLPPIEELPSDKMDVVEAEGTAANLPGVESLQILKVIKKLEVSCLCPQHNPVRTLLDVTCSRLTLLPGCHSCKESEQAGQDKKRFACVTCHGTYQDPRQLRRF
jgi:hypothetical protein